MTIKEIMDRDMLEAESRSEMPHYTNDEVRHQNTVELVIIITVTLAFAAFMIWWNVAKPLRERAAYLEGFLGVDHDTAMSIAEGEVR